MRDAPEMFVALRYFLPSILLSFLPSFLLSFLLLSQLHAAFLSSLLALNCSWVRLLRAAVGNLVVGTLMAPLQLACSLAAFVLEHCVLPFLLLFLYY